MPTRTVSGTHEFTLPYCLARGTAAEFDCRCRFVATLGEGASGVREITDIEVSVIGEPCSPRSWAAPDAHLETLIRRYLHIEGAQDLVDRALSGGVVA